MRIGVTGISAVAALLAAIGIVRAQAPPPGPLPGPLLMPSAPGFVSTYEIVRTLRAAGFDPLAPPLREGTIYVARATDYRGILMRVVLDARTGAIRDANRIVPGPGNYAGPYGEPYSEADDAYGGPPYGPGPYGPPDADEPDGYGPRPYGRLGAIPSPYDPPLNRSPMIGAPPSHAASGSSVPPLPRPRPPELAARQPAATSKPATAGDPKPAVANDPAKPDVKASAPQPPVATPPPAAAQAAPAPSLPPKPSSTLTIKN